MILLPLALVYVAELVLLPRLLSRGLILITIVRALAPFPTFNGTKVPTLLRFILPWLKPRAIQTYATLCN